MKGISFFALGLIILFVSCNQGEKTNDGVLRYKYFRLQKNGWKSQSQTQTLDDINFTATEVPLQYYILKDRGSDDLFAADSIYQQSNDERIIEFEFLHDEEQPLLDRKFTSMDYSTSIEYLSGKIQHDFRIVTQKLDTIQCVGVLYERRYDVAPFEKVMLFFSGINPDEKIQLIYDDRLFGKGTIKFKFSQKLTPVIL